MPRMAQYMSALFVIVLVSNVARADDRVVLQEHQFQFAGYYAAL